MRSEVQLEVNAGCDFLARVEVFHANSLPFSLSGFATNSTVRKSPESSVIYLTPTVAIESGSNSMTIAIAAEDSANIVSGVYHYDLVISNASTTMRIIEGPMLILGGSTK